MQNRLYCFMARGFSQSLFLRTLFQSFLLVLIFWITFAVSPVLAQSNPLDLEVAISRDPIKPGEGFFYTAVVSNTGSSAITNVSLSYFKTNPFDFFSFPVGTLMPGQHRIIRSSIKAPANAQSGDEIAMAFTASGSNNQDATSNKIIAIQQSPTPDLDIVITTEPNPIEPGGEITYTITYGNSGQSNAVNKILSVTLPENVAVVDEGGGVSIGNNLQWNLANLPAGEGGQRRFTVMDTAGQAGRILLAQADIGNSGAGTQFDARTSTTAVVRASQPLTLDVTANPARVASGDSYVYTITITNTSSGVALQNVRVSSRIPEHVNPVSENQANPVFTCFDDPGGSSACDPGEQFIWSFNPLPSGQTRTMQLPMEVSNSTPDGTVIDAFFKAGFSGDSDFATEIEAVSVTPFAILDVDGNSRAEPLLDGLMILRFLFGFTGNALTTGALFGDATRTSEEITAYLQGVRADLDVDDDGQSNPLTDGLIILRFLFGFRGDALIINALGADARGTDPAEIANYITGLL